MICASPRTSDDAVTFRDEQVRKQRRVELIHSMRE